MSTQVRVGSRVEWTWWCGEHEEDSCGCSGVGTGTVVELVNGEDDDWSATVKVDDGDREFMSVFDENVLQVIT